MRQDGGDSDGDQRDGEGVDDGHVQREESQQQEKCIAIYEHPGGLRSEKEDQPWKDSYKCDGIGESNDGKDDHGEMGHQGDGINGEMGHRGEGSTSIVGEKMMGRENVRLKLALVECRLLLHDQVNLMGRDNNACQVNHKMFLKESQLSRERAVADARLVTITAQLARSFNCNNQQ